MKQQAQFEQASFITIRWDTTVLEHRSFSGATQGSTSHQSAPVVARLAFAAGPALFALHDDRVARVLGGRAVTIDAPTLVCVCCRLVPPTRFDGSDRARLSGENAERFAPVRGRRSQSLFVRCRIRNRAPASRRANPAKTRRAGKRRQSRCVGVTMYRLFGFSRFEPPDQVVFDVGFRVMCTAHQLDAAAFR